MPTNGLKISDLLKERGQELDLSIIAGAGGLGNVVATPELNRPAMAFAGFYDVFTFDRIQILGNTEMTYLRSLPDDERKSRIVRTLAFKIPCMIVTDCNAIDESLISACNDSNVPLVTTCLPTTRLVSLLINYLDRQFAPVESVHADLLDVYGMGTLITGSSGVGKSECALELIERGHRLVADDIVIVRKLSNTELIGRSSDLLKYHMEIRGLGILNIEMLFGVASVVDEKKLELIVHLERWDESRVYDRLGIDDMTQEILGVEVPQYVIPVQPGRNISIMVEMAALTQRLRNRGIYPAKQMEERLTARMANGDNSPLL